MHMGASYDDADDRVELRESHSMKDRGYLASTLLHGILWDAYMSRYWMG